MSIPTKLSLAATAAVEVQAEGAEPRLDAAGNPKRPTFKIHGYTGDVMSVGGFYHPVIVDLGGLKASRPRIPILLGHDPDRIIGQSDEVSVDAEGVHISGTITGDSEHAREVISHAKNGFEWQASIGADIVPGKREFLEAGKTAVVNGREVAGPLLIAREARLVETSFVAIGADQKTSASVAASKTLGSPSKGESSMNFEQWLEAKGQDPAAISDQFRAYLRLQFDIEQKPPAKTPAPSTPPDPAGVRGFSDIIAARRDEDQRVRDITALAQKTIDERPFLTDEVEKMGEVAIEAKTPFKEFKLAILELRAEAGSGPMVISRAAPELGPKMLEATICRSCNLPGIEKKFDEKALNASDRAYPRGIGLRELLVVAARQNGYSGPERGDERDILEAAFGRPGTHLRAGGFSTISLGGILGAVANKFVRAAFEAVDSAWRPIASRTNVSDFKAITTYSLTGDLTYEEVGASGDIKHGTLGSESYTNQVKTYARMLAITRRDIKNDDMGALTRIPTRLGRGGALKLNDVFWTVFLNNSAFFTSGRTNAISGATPGSNDSRLNIEGLTRAETAFFNLTDPDGKPIAAMPKILLVPTALKTAAFQLMNSTEIRDTTANTAAGTTNPHSGKYQIVTSPYMSNSTYTGYSATAWYLLSDPNDVPVVEVAFLDGRETPVVESADADFDTLGVQYRGYFDFGAAMQEYRGGVRAAGA